MRVISLVPSWTETLLEVGINIVGRTRYCIYPVDQIDHIPVIGGTKEVNWELIRELRPDVILMDQEENPIDLAMESPVPVLVTHVTSIESLQHELTRLGEYFENARMIQMALFCLDVLELPSKVWEKNNIPGEITRIGHSTKDYNQVMYLIWKKPWMSIGKNTYIGSVLTKLGAQLFEAPFDEKYPIVELEDAPDAFLLFSTEPFPFHKKTKDLNELHRDGVVVDGEVYSWFGIRSLKFLYKVFFDKEIELDPMAAVDGKGQGS